MLSDETREPDPRLAERLERLSPGERAFVEARLRAARANRPDDTIPRRNAAPAAPLSFEQEMLWRIEQTIPDRSTYNVPRAMRIRGPLDVERLRAALDALVVRHDVLRTRFVERAGAPVSVTMPAQSASLERLTLAATDATERDVELADTLRNAASRPFDLGADQLLRATLIDINEDEHALLLVWHHIASDAASGDILMRELAALYAGLPLPELPLRYADFATWQRERLTDARRDALLAYWRPQLAQATPRLALPVSGTPGRAPSFEGARRSYLLPRELADAVASLAQAQHTTPFITLLAAFATLLQRYAGASDIVVGTVLSGRDRPELENLVGYFANVLPLRTSFAGDPTFINVLERVRDSYFDASEHADVPFETLMLEARGPQGSGFALPVMFTTLAGERTTPPLADLSLEAIAIDRKVSKFQLTFAAGLDGAGLRLALEYRTDLFDDATIARLCGHFRTLLEAIVADPTARIATLPLLTLAEHSELARWNDTSVAAADETLADLIERAAAASPHEPAVVCDDRRLTFGQLNALADRLAARLARSGVGPDVLVGVYMQRVPELVVALLAVAKAGGAYLPIDPAYPAARVAFMLQDAGVTLCLTQPHLGATLTAPLEIITLDTAGRAADEDGAADANPALRKATPDSLAYVIYTSGSTGTPKGAMIRQRGLVNYLRWCTQAYNVAAGIGAPVHSSISFDLTVTSLWAPLVAGRTAFLVPDDGIEALAQVLRSRRNFSLVKCTPAHLGALRLELGDDDVADMCRLFVIGGEALFGESLGWWQRRAPRTMYVNEYGPTETVVGCAVEFVRGDDRINGAVPIGRPIAATQLHVLDRNGQVLPVGVAGELFIAGRGVGAGYLGRPQLTAERFVPDPFSEEENARMYRSGDVVRRRADGVLNFLGRTDDQVKVRGYRIELGEIQGALASHPSVAAAAVVVRDDVAGGPALVAYYVLYPTATATNDDVRAHLRERLPAYMVPNLFQRLAAIPLTSNGKVDRVALPPPDATAATATPSIPPSNPIESAIAARIGELLRCAPPSVHDDFFEIGGHSLSAMRLLAAVTTAFGVRVSLHDFFEAPTVAALATRVAALRAVGTDGAADEMGIVGRRIDDPAPLTAGQTLLWLQEQAAPGLAVYNVPLTFAAIEEIDVDALQRALDALVLRHAALRTRFTQSDGEPLQVVGTTYSVPLTVLDVRSLPEARRQTACERRLSRDARAPFDLEKGELLRACLVRLEDERWRIMFVAHHIVFDGWSAGVFLRELALCYDAARAGTAPALPPLPIAFIDYAGWEQRTLRDGRLAALVDFWREKLVNVAAGLALAADRRAADDSYEGATIAALLAPELVARLTDIGRARGATLFMVLVAAFQTFLHRYTTQDDIVIGSPAVGRARPETLGLIGYFANPLALRGDLSGDPTFDDLLDRTRTMCLEAFDHADVPTEIVAREFLPTRAPLFEAMLTLQADAPWEYHLGDAALQALPVERGVAAFPLSLSFSPQSGGLRCALRYRTALFAANGAERMLEHLHALLLGIARDPTAPISALPLLSAEERSSPQRDFERCDRPVPSDETLLDLFAARVSSDPGSIALSCGDERLSYRELDQRANRLAHRLAALGVGPERSVGIYLERSLDVVLAILSVLKAGGCYLPLDPANPRERLAFILDDAKPAVVLTVEALRGQLPATAAVIVPLDRAQQPTEREPSDPLAGGLHADNLAYIIYTSGSSGQPKGVMVTHRNVVRLLRASERDFDFDERDVWTLFHSYAFDFSVWEMWGALAYGGRLIVVPHWLGRSPQDFHALLRCEGVTVLNATPSAFRELMRADLAQAQPLAALRLVVFGGEALDPGSLRPWFERYGDERPRLVNMYGITETTVHVTVRPLSRTDADSTSSPIGKPLADLRLLVLDSRGQVVPIGVPGELYVGGPGLARGYLNRPELTAARFVRDPFLPGSGQRLYRTGDRVRQLRDGSLEFLGRVDAQVKVRGFRIELGEIESVLVRHAAVRHACATLQPGSNGEAAICAYYVPAVTAMPRAELEKSLWANLRASLAEYMLPAHLMALDALPLTPNGKLNRKALPAPGVEALRIRSTAFVAPRDATENVLATIFAEVLGTPLSQVGIDDDFFAIGGHSLLAMRVVARVGTILRAPFSVRRFFEAPTVRGIATALTQDEPTPGRIERVAGVVRMLQEMTPEERQRRLGALANDAGSGAERAKATS